MLYSLLCGLANAYSTILLLPDSSAELNRTIIYDRANGMYTRVLFPLDGPSALLGRKVNDKSGKSQEPREKWPVDHG